MPDAPFVIHGPATALHPSQPSRTSRTSHTSHTSHTLVLDSPHSGRWFPADMGAVVSEAALRDGEDCFIDDLWLPATQRGVPLLAAQFARTDIDPNRHAGDIDLGLVEGGAWPDAWQPSGKARIGKALVWRTLDDGRAIYGRKLGVDELRGRIARCHRPYHAALRGLLDAAHQRHGVVYHLNCHSMNPVSGVMGEGGAGRPRADIVLGDRDGSTCAPEFTAWVRQVLVGMGYDVAVNDPYKGVELVRAFADPAGGRHSLQIEVNKRLYMAPGALDRTNGFARLQRDLMGLVEAICERFAGGRLGGQLGGDSV